jgi:TDG/mug DNA glycosylase family protein
MDASEGFPPVVGSDARILILGSLPGRRSLTENKYYAHPQNVFWRIMRELFDIAGDYEERCDMLKFQRIALWDVLRESVRPGSMDADIRIETATANDFREFLDDELSIEKIAFNGKKAEQLFRRLVPTECCQHLQLVGLPSTSPAYAAMTYKGKLNAWQKGLELI